MSTIFPLSASVNQEFDGYRFNGTSWDIIGIDLTADYLEESAASATYLTKVNASTTYATKTELNNIDLSSASAAAVAAIVDSAPSTLNTLNELAAALGDDANYASTITTALGNKLNISTASSTYLTQASASSTYALKNNPEFLTTLAEPNFDLPSTAVGSGSAGFTSASGYATGVMIFDALPSASAAFSPGDIFYLVSSDGIDNIDFTVLSVGTSLVSGNARLSTQVTANISNLAALQSWAFGYNVGTNGEMWYNTVGEIFMKIAKTISSYEITSLDGISSNIQSQIDSKAYLYGAAFTGEVSITQSGNSSNYPLTISSANEQGGGSGFSDILKIINSKSGATNINKHFRMNSSGTLEIINSAYTASIFSVSDDGTVTSSNLGETGWSTVGSFSNSFVSGGNAPGYRRLNNVVYLRGNINSGTAGQTAFTLPSGYRPATDFVIPVQKFGTPDISYITVYTDGRVVPNSTAGWLTGIHFPVG